MHVSYLYLLYNLLTFKLTVASPYDVTVAAHNTQIVGQSLTLECSVTTVRGITSRVDIVWSSDGIEIEKIEGVNVSLSWESAEIYSASYTIPILNTTDNGRVYRCEVVINTSPPVTAENNFTVDVIGLFTIDVIILYQQILCFSSYSGSINCTIWLSRGSYSRQSSRNTLYSEYS